MYSIINTGIRVFHLQHPGFKPVIQQHIEAQDLEAGTACGVVGEAGVVVVFEDGVSGDQSLYDHVLDVVPHLVGVAFDGLEELVQGGQFSTEVNKKRAELYDDVFYTADMIYGMFVPFAACVIVTEKVRTVLVDGVVCEMHAHIILTVVRQGSQIKYIVSCW